jgi:hypothetical protein
MPERSEVLPVLAGKLIFKYEQKRQNLIVILTVDFSLFVILSQGQHPFHFLALRFQLCYYKLIEPFLRKTLVLYLVKVAVPDIQNVHKKKYRAGIYNNLWLLGTE